MTSSEKFSKVPGNASVSCLFTWLGTRGNYEQLARKDSQLSGWRRYFSAVTKEGRASIVVATYAVTAITGFLVWRKYIQSKNAPPGLKQD